MIDKRESLISSIVDAVLASLDVREVLVNLTERLGSALGASRCVAQLYDADGTSAQAPIEWSIHVGDAGEDIHSLVLAKHLRSALVELQDTLAVNDIDNYAMFDPVEEATRALDVRSVLAVITRFNGVPNGAVILYQCETPRDWTADDREIFERAAYFAGVAIHHAQAFAHASAVAEQRASGQSAVTGAVLELSASGVIEEVTPEFERLTGLSAEDIIGERLQVILEELVHDSDRARVFERYRQSNLEADTPSLFRIVRSEELDERMVIDIHLKHPRHAGKLVQFVDVTESADVGGENGSSEARYRRLVEHSDAIIFHTDSQFCVTFISRRALDFFGVSPEDFVAGDLIRWFDLIHPDDREAVQERADEQRQARTRFDEEYRVVNRVTGRVRWMLTRFVPVRNEDGEIEGWDGFGIDITSRREAQEALDIQSKKVRALYTVSSAIRGYLDPANIASRGIAALCDATGAEAGLCYLFDEQKRESLELVAHHGFSAGVIERFDKPSHLPSLSTYVANHSQSVVVPEMRSDPRASRMLAEEEGLRSAVLVPICVEDETLGTIGMFSRKPSAFDGGDVMLVGAAANQIGLAARQARLFNAYKKQAKILSAVYRISHDLSRNMPTEELFQSAFTIVREELGLKRLWLGLLNETGTRIIGQGAYGPGWKRQLVEINVEVRGRDHPIARVVATRKPVVIDDSDEVLREFGVKRVFSRLGIHSVALVPLNAGGQVLGVLGVQPSRQEANFRDDEIALLSNLANEIAAILLTKRLEERIAEAEKMRTAGLLAGGIAHNFNNLLQAILGQASLLEMQGESSERVRKAVKVINSAATKGASLVRQLLSFAQLEEPKREVCDVNDIVDRSANGLDELINQEQEIRFELKPKIPRAYFDPGQLQRIVATLVKNASEAMERGTIEVFSDSIRVDQKSPHFEVPYGDFVRVGVRDSGIGMDEETKRRCFEPFFTTKNVDPGSGLGMTGAGLGLAAAYTLARRNGGRLIAEGRPGHGSVFTLYLPVAQGEKFEDEATLQTIGGQVEKVTAGRSAIEGIRKKQRELLKRQRENTQTLLNGGD